MKRLTAWLAFACLGMGVLGVALVEKGSASVTGPLRRRLCSRRTLVHPPSILGSRKVDFVHSDMIPHRLVERSEVGQAYPPRVVPGANRVCLEAESLLASMNPADRAKGVDALQREGGDNAAERLLEVLRKDGDGYVRERALFGYVAIAGREAVPTLMDLAQSEGESLSPAACANLDLLRDLGPESPAGWIEVIDEGPFAAGDWFPFTIRYGGRDSTQEILLELIVPKDIEVSASTKRIHKGSLHAGEPKEHQWMLRAVSSELTGVLKVRLQIDRPGNFDAETVEVLIPLVIRNSSVTTLQPAKAVSSKAKGRRF